MTADLFMATGAEFSPCGRYRGLLWRRWDPVLPPLVAILLNPSTADAEVNDPTVTRCIVRAQIIGFGGLRVGNIFTLRSTDPAELKRCDDPVGPDADGYLERMCQDAGMILCGWGSHGTMKGYARRRCDEVVSLLAGDLGHSLYALRLTKTGQPEHPLYISYGVKPFLWMDRAGIAGRAGSSAVERPAHNGLVAGSNPVRHTIANGTAP